MHTLRIQPTQAHSTPPIMNYSNLTTCKRSSSQTQHLQLTSSRFFLSSLTSLLLNCLQILIKPFTGWCLNNEAPKAWFSWRHRHKAYAPRDFSPQSSQSHTFWAELEGGVTRVLSSAIGWELLECSVLLDLLKEQHFDPHSPDISPIYNTPECR
ncbi:uncharacterized protein [Cherax quadricarinatus]|uniref:uncharacterized protein n=1 Tax=Cherax quadricarinatus TaxID=27406 RepID=UPI00387EA72B